MKKVLYILTSGLLAATALTGCLDDTSSESSRSMGIISVTGINSEYNLISFSESLAISPQVSSSDASDTFEYLWTLYDNGLLSQVGVDLPVDTLARTKNLDFALDMVPGAYTVVFHVINTATRYSEFFTTTLNASTSFSSGYYLMKENAAGNTEMDFFGSSGQVIYNVIERVTGAPMEGKPNNLRRLRIYYWLDPQTSETVQGSVIIPTSDRDLKIISLNDLTLVYDHSTMFYGEEPDDVPLILSPSLYYPFYVSEDGTYVTRQYEGRMGSGMYGLPVVPDGGCSFSKYIVGGLWTTALCLFDQLNGRFVTVDYLNNVMVPSYINGPWPNNDREDPVIRDQLIFLGGNSPAATPSSGQSRTDVNSFAIFEKESGDDQRWVYSINTNQTDPITFIRPMTNDLVFHTAQVYACLKADDRAHIFGGVGERLYLYNVTTDEEKEIELSGFGAGEQITMITHKNISTTENYLMIGTNSNGNYKVYLYGLLAGEPSGQPVAVMEGTGKVVDIQHTETTRGYINY